MNVQRRPPAERTVAVLQEAARVDVPILIPGAREVRVGSRPVDRRAQTGSPASIDTAARTLNRPSQLEYEREGGGAPSQRPSASHRTPVARLRHWLFNGISRRS